MRHRQDGVAMITVIMGILAIVLMTVMIQKLASNEISQSNYQAREDTVLAGTEAMLERYAAKLTIDPLYYQRWVDEGEAPRECTDTSSVGFGATVNPGNAWIVDCGSWDYVETTTFYEHPLLGGDPGKTADDVGVLIHVSPPTGTEPLELAVVGRQAEHINPRVVEAEVRPQAISEFARMVEGELRYGAGAETHGKIYAGTRLGYRTGSSAYADVFAGTFLGGWSVYGPPAFYNGAEGFDSTGGHNAGGLLITDIYPDPIDFDRFWDDLDLLQNAACLAGICLDPASLPAIPATVKAYLIETIEVGGVTKIDVSYSTSTPAGPSCQSSEERWWLNSQSAAWSYLGRFDIPNNGTLWGNQHIVIGRNSTSPFVLGGALTVYAGDSSSRKNIIIGSDVAYKTGLDGTDIIGIIASDEVWINPNAVGADKVWNLYGALLNQNGQMQTARDCGTTGSNLTPAGSRLFTYGSNASLGTGNMSCCFSPRSYDFDPRLEALRPPLFPLLSDKWTYTNWRESPTPCWALTGGC